MTVTIKLNMAHPKFAPLASSPERLKLSVAINGVSPVPFFVYQRYPLTYNSMGDAAVNPRTLLVSYKRPLVFTNAEFEAFGPTDTFTANKWLTVLADYVKRGVLTVDEDGTPLSSDDVLNYSNP